MKVIIDGKEYEGRGVELDNFSEIMWSDVGQKFRVRDKRFIKKEVFPRVPENIKIVNAGNLLGIKFGEEQTLFKYPHYKSYGVDGGGIGFYSVDCELVPCERKDLKPGDIAFRNDEDETLIFKDLESYCIILDDFKCVFISGEQDIRIDDETWDTWYKVRPMGVDSK